MGISHILTLAIGLFLAARSAAVVPMRTVLAFGGSEDERILNDMVILWVDKASLSANLMTWSEDRSHSELLMAFKIAIGKEEGDKQYEGDNKTPEGIYFSQRVLEGKKLPAKYGPLAIPIDFPNPLDRLQGKTGHGIWLHGVEKDQRIEAAKVTEGCVAFYNADIVSLAKWLQPYQSIIMITKNDKGVNDPQDIEKLTELTKAWADSWKNRDLKRYISFYDGAFKHRHGGVKAYEDYKGRVFKNYREMKVDITNIRVLSHEAYAVAVMNQKFNGDNRFEANGRKIIYWSKNSSGSWGIVNETFENRPIIFTKFTNKEVVDLFKDSPSKKVFEAKQAASPAVVRY